MLSCNHLEVPGGIEKEQNLTRMQLGRMRQLEEPGRRAAKWIRYDDRIQKLCGLFNRQTNVINFLKKVAHVCLVYVNVNIILCFALQSINS